MPGEQHCRGSPSPQPPTKNRGPAGRTPEARSADPDWPLHLRGAGPRAGPPLGGTPRADAPPAPDDPSFQKGFPDPPGGFASSDYGSPRSPPPRAPPSGGHGPCTASSRSAQAWPHPAATFRVPPDPEPFSYPFVAPHGASPKPFSEGAAGRPYAPGAPLFASPGTPGEWRDEGPGTDPAYPVPAPPLCYPSLSNPQDLGGADPEPEAVPAAPSPFSGSRTFLEGLLGAPRGGPGELPSALPQGPFPSPGSLDLPLVSSGQDPARLPQLWGPAAPPYPLKPPLGPPAAAGVVFLEEQPSLPQGPPLPWAQVLPPAGRGAQQVGVLSPPPFPPGTLEWPVGSRGALGESGPGAQLGALGTSPGQPGGSPQLSPYCGLKGLILGVGQPQASPPGPPLPPEVAASPGESPLPSPAAPTAGSSCPLSPPSGSPADPRSEDSQLPGPPRVPASFPHPRGAAPRLPDPYPPVSAFPGSAGGTQGAFGGLQTFPGEAPCSEQHFLDQLGVLLTCRQCDRNYGSVAAFLGHRPFCSPPAARPQDAPPQLPGSPTPPATPKAPSDGIPGPFPLPGTGPALLAEGKEETLGAPFPPPAALDLDLEDAAKLDSLITEALRGLECQAHSPEIDGSFIDVFTDEESTGAGPREPQAPQPAGGSPPASGRPQTRSRGLVPAEGGRHGPAIQQRRGKRFKLPVQERGLAARVGRGSRGPRLRPRGKSQGEQAPGGRAGPRKVRRRARRRTWAKDLTHKTVGRQRTPGRLSLPPAAHRSDSGADSDADEDNEGPHPHLSCPRGPRGGERKGLDSSPGPQAGGPQQRAPEEGRPEARGGAPGTAAPLPLLVRGPAASPGQSWPGPPCTSAPGDPAQKPPSPEIAGEISQMGFPITTAPRETPGTAGPLVSSGHPRGPCTVASGLGGGPALGQACNPSSGHPHQGPSSDWTPAQATHGHLDGSGGAAGAPHVVGTGPGLAGSALALVPPSSSLSGARPPPGSPPSPPLSDSGCAPGPGVQSEPQLDIRGPTAKREGQLETSPGSPGTPGQPSGAAWASPAPQGSSPEAGLPRPGPEAATASPVQVTRGSVRGKWEGTVTPGELHALPTPGQAQGRRSAGPRKPCRQRAGRIPRAHKPDTHLAPDVTFGGVGALPQGRTPPRTSPQDRQAAFCPLLHLPAVGRESTPSSGVPSLSANAHRLSDLQGSCAAGDRGGFKAQTDPPGTAFAPADSTQLSPAEPMAEASPAQEEPPTAPSGGPRDLHGVQRPPAPQQRAPCTPEPPPGPLLDSPSESQSWARPEDRTATPTGPQEDSPRGDPPSRVVSPGVAPAVPRSLDTVRAARLGPGAGQGTASASSEDTSGATRDVPVPVATLPRGPPAPQPREDGAAFPCEVCSAAFRSRPGLNRHRARRHGLCRAHPPQLHDTPRRKSHVPSRKEKPRLDVRNAPGLAKPGRPGKGGAGARPRPSGTQAEPGTRPGGRVQRPSGEPPGLPPASNTSSSGLLAGSACSPGCPVLPGPEPGVQSSQPPGRGAPDPAAEGPEPGKGCGVRVARLGSVERPQAKRRRGRREPAPSYCRDLSRVPQGPSQAPGSLPESLGTCGPEDGMQEREGSPPAASSPGPRAPAGEDLLPLPFPPGTFLTRKNAEACGKPQARTKPSPPPEAHPELAGAWDPGTPGNLPTDLSGSGPLCLDGPFLLDGGGGGPWDPHPGLWAQDRPENVPELHRVPAAWGGPLGETPPSPGGGSPEPPSLDPEPFPSLVPAGAPGLQLLSVQLGVQDLHFLGSWEGATGPPVPRAQKGAHARSVCLPHFRGLSCPPAPPPTCYMCVERRFGSGELLREHLRKRHSQSRPGPWACGMCLREVADVWAYNAHLQAHAESFAHLGPASGAPGWDGHGPRCLDGCGGQADRTPDGASGPELPGGGGPGALAMAVPGGCRDATRDCHHCAKRFPKPFKLQRHLAVHSPLRVFLCPRCPRAYLQPGVLRAHLGAAHGAWAEQDVPPTALFSCELCADVACSSRRPLACSACNLTFAKKDQLHRHLDKHRRRARLPAPLRRGWRPGATQQDPPGSEGSWPGKRRRVALPSGPLLSSPPRPLSPGYGRSTPRGDTCPDPPPACLDVATHPAEEPQRAPSECLSAAPDHDKGSREQAGSPPSPRAEVPPCSSCPPAQQAAPLRPGPRRQRTEDKSGGRSVPGTDRLPAAPCPGAPSTPRKPDPKCPPAARAGSGGSCLKPGGRLGGTTARKALPFPAQHRKAAGSTPPTGLGPQHNRDAGGSWPQPASGRLQSEAASTPTASTPTRADPAGQSPAPDRPPAEGRSRSPPGPGEAGKHKERRKARGVPSVPDKPPRAPRKQATPCRVLPAKSRPGAQGSRATRQAPGEPRQQALARASPHVGPLHQRLERSCGDSVVAAASPHTCRTAESQSRLLSQLFGPRLSRFKIPLKKGPTE